MLSIIRHNFLIALDHLKSHEIRIMAFLCGRQRDKTNLLHYPLQWSNDRDNLICALNTDCGSAIVYP